MLGIIVTFITGTFYVILENIEGNVANNPDIDTHSTTCIQRLTTNSTFGPSTHTNNTTYRT
jgi:hypothetical protein